MSQTFDESASGKGLSLRLLQERAFGGEDVATRPGLSDDDAWPKGPLLPGVEELLDDFSLRPHRNCDLRLSFLLGGAGNGKSFAARELGTRLNMKMTSDSLARRIYHTESSGAAVHLLNDATIAPIDQYGSGQAVAMTVDIDGWWQASANNPVAAFCCVNRGIIIDELRALAAHEESYELARSLMAWLAAPQTSLRNRLGGAEATFQRLLLGDHFFEEQFIVDGRSVYVSALAVDACSLLEVDETTRESRAGGLFTSVLASCREEAMARPLDCPIRANVLQWSSREGHKFVSVHH